MRYLISISLLLLLSCGQNSKKVKSEDVKTDTTTATTEDTSKIPDIPPLLEITPEEKAVNSSLQARYGNQWQALNDKSAKWMKDAFDYFIVPARRNDPNYPYIIRGDYNGDNIADTAAVVTDSTRAKFQLAILMGDNRIIFWDEDILHDAALSTLVKPGEIKGMESGDIEKVKTVRTKSDAIEVTYFEQASFVLYWDKKGFKRIQTSD